MECQCGGKFRQVYQVRRDQHGRITNGYRLQDYGIELQGSAEWEVFLCGACGELKYRRPDLADPKEAA